MPYHHVMRFQMHAPMSAASTTVCVTMARIREARGDGLGDRGAGDGADEVEHAGDDDRGADRQHAGRDDGGDGVRRVVEAVDVVEDDRRRR